MKETLEQAKARYSGEWIAFLVHEEKEEIEKMEGEVIEHHIDRRELHKKLRQRNVKNAHTTFPVTRLCFDETIFGNFYNTEVG